MNWENLEDFNNEGDKDASSAQNKINSDKMQTEEEDARTVKLKKYRNPSENLDRQALIDIANRFGDLLVQNRMEEIINTLFAENCECFFFNFLESDPIYAIGSKYFPELYQGVRIIERKTREILVDVDRNLVCQICDCSILQPEGESAMTQATFELFTINYGKIVRYRAGFSCYVPAHGPADPFEPTRKEIRLAKVKELNYALAGQPNLEKLALLLHEKTEYKMLDFDREKVHTFHKQDIIERFKSIEDYYALKSIVPYEVYSDREYVIGTYVYYLEKKDVNPGKEYVWLSTCVYSFDNDLNIFHINQQGELFPKEDATIPFEVQDREKINEKVCELLEHLKVDVDIFYTHKVDFNCTITRFGPKVSPLLGTHHGLKEYASFLAKVRNGLTLEWSKPVDVYVDLNDPSYDAAIVMTCGQGVINSPGYKDSGKRMNFMTITKYCFENGKLAKMYQLYFKAPEPIPSPFEDPNFEGINIRPWNICS